MVIAYHLIWTVYGTWLPNDPRGSGSRRVDSAMLSDLGELHHGRKMVQPAGRDIRAFYAAAAPRLQHEVVRLSPTMLDVVGAAMGLAITEEKYTCWACAVMPDHVHVLVRKHRDSAEVMTEKLKKAGAGALSRERLVDQTHPVWSGGGGWKVFLDHLDAVRRTIRYIERNPRQPQRWDFVKRYDGWPLHPGHSSRSPYAKALRAAGRYP
ncbi:MAG: hypothetical protein AAGL98_12880 [Planctomycetota bacterium]